VDRGVPALDAGAVSEYQYYEFMAVDRPLDRAQMAELRALSTRARITPSSFVNEYHWGNFRGDPCRMVEAYFDAFLYLANWGTHQVMFRLPTRLLDPAVAGEYCAGDSARAWTGGEHVVLDLSSQDEDGEDWIEPEGLLATIVPVRAELAEGDLRGLYLAWLACVRAGELADEVPEPPVPPGLGALNAAQRCLADFLRVDEDLLAVAASASAPLAAKQPPAAELSRWVRAMPATDKDAILMRLLSGDDAHLRTELLRRFGSQPVAVNGGDRRTVAQLLDAAETRRTGRRREAERRRAADQARRERAATAAREKHLQDLSSRHEQAWQQVDTLIDTKRPREYDAAVVLLQDLQAVGDRDGGADAFRRRLGELRRRHQRKPSLIERLDRAGLTERVGSR